MRFGWRTAAHHAIARRVAGTTLLALGVLLLAACGDAGDRAPDADAPLTVVATTTQIADMAAQVAGSRASVASLLPANADAHDFEPTPRDIEKLANAGLVLRHGLDFDPWVENMVAAAGGDLHVVTVTDGIATSTGGHAHAHDEDEDEDEADDHDEGAVDPHVWLDVANAQLMVAQIRDALIAADPQGRAEYTSSASRYLDELDELDTWIRQQIETIPAERRKLVTNHDAFGYYVNAYGLEFVGSIIPSLDSHAQPSARETAELIDRIRQEGVRAIFTEAAINPDLATQLAEEAGVIVVDDLYADSLGDEDSRASTYIEMMRHNTTTIVEALR